jgi:putative peptide zinc metalloprotease protein
MPASLYSPSWYRVASLTLHLRPHVRIHRQTFRGEVWYIVQDNQTGRYHRLSHGAYRVLSLLDGGRTVQDAWAIARDELGADTVPQDDVLRLLSLLHGADLIAGGDVPYMAELDERSRRMRRREFLARFKNPLAIRTGLFDPNRFLDATLPAVRWMFSPFGFCLWLALVATGTALVAMHWPQMSQSAVDQAFSLQNVALILALYPVIKGIHELGHAYAAKAWGGEVHEFGLMWLVFLPMPYVDASAAAAFREKHRRMVVAGAGILVELALASIAMIVWVLVEPGAVRAIAFNVVLIAGVSTLVFNGNPLLRFDGYYVLVDLVEIPNLAQRANAYMLHVIQRHLFGVPDLASPVTARGEAGWFVGYGLLALAYRLVVTFGIALFVAGHFFFIGVLLAVASLAGAIVWPLLKGLSFLVFSPQLKGRRGRAAAVTSAGVAGLVALLLAVPVTYATLAEGVIWIADDEATVRTASEGVVVGFPFERPAAVGRDDVVAKLDDPLLVARMGVVERQLEELKVRLEAANVVDRVQARVVEEQIRHAEGQLQDMRRSVRDLDVRVRRAGTFVPVDPVDVVGQFRRKGDVLGYVVGPDAGGIVVRTVVDQADLDMVRSNTAKVDVRLASDPGRSLGATIVRQVPAALADLPHGALAVTGGGRVLVDRGQTDRLRPLETLYQFDLAIAGLPPDSRLGMRVFVRFGHPSEPIGVRIVRAVRQAFLRQFNV